LTWVADYLQGGLPARRLYTFRAVLVGFVDETVLLRLDLACSQQETHIS